MKYLKIAIYILVVAVLAGCARGEPYKQVVKTAPEIAAGQGRIYFYRKPGLFSDGAILDQPVILLDGEKIGRARPKGFFYLDVPAGNHEVVVHTEVDKTLSLTIDAGETKYVRTELTTGVIRARAVPELIEPRVAKKEMRRLRLGGQASANGDVGASETAE